MILEEAMNDSNYPMSGRFKLYYGVGRLFFTSVFFTSDGKPLLSYNWGKIAALFIKRCQDLN